jgi:hypothetical protein
MEVEVALPFSQTTATFPELSHLLHTLAIFLSRSTLVALSDLRLRLAKPFPPDRSSVRTLLCLYRFVDSFYIFLDMQSNSMNMFMF